jgi:serine/threonine protein kinase
MHMNESPDCSLNQLSTGWGLRQMLMARMSGELSDDQFVQAIRGTCTKSEFVDAIAKQLDAEPCSISGIMALINRLSQRGDIPSDVVRLLESRIASGGARSAQDGITVDLGRNSTGLTGIVERQPSLLRVGIGCVLRDRYEIAQFLGTGGKGSVFKARDRYRSSLPPSLQYVAIKLLHEVPGTQDETIEALRRELQSAQTLSHPNIVKVYDVDRDGDVDFFTMELLEGELLSDLMRRFQPLPISRPYVWSIVRQIAAGLEHAHARKIVHADLKPQNIMITNSGEVRILDFGSSYPFAGENQVEPIWRRSSATPAYACCELLAGRAPDPRDDLYSLACITYELLTGVHPFQRRRANEARDFGVVPARPSSLSRRQWQTLAKGLAWHRAARSVSVGDWFKALRPGPEPAQPWTNIGEVKAAPVRAQRPPPLSASAVFSVLISIAAISVLFVRLAPGGKVSGAALSASAINEKTAPATENSEEFSTGALSAFSAPAASPQPAPSHGASIMPSEYQVQPGQHFAEIRLHRPPNARRDAVLTWWTEPASAKPGVDYVSQAKVSQSFPKGQDSMSVFVKLLPKAKRGAAEVFYIAVADQDAKSARQIAHTAVRLPSNGSSL